MPFYHPEKKIWIEIHTSLFPLSSSEEIFKPEHIFNRTFNSQYYTYNVKYLVKEFELIYTCAHWALENNWMKGLIRIVDILYILNKTDDKIDWNIVLTWLEKSPVTASYLYLVLSYLVNNNYISLPTNVLINLSNKQKKLNTINLFILHKLIDKYLIEGRQFGSFLTINNVDIIWNTLTQGSDIPLINLLQIPWNLLFPPENIKRYNLKFQLSRILRVFTSS